jgi:hypothetical protein
MMNQGFGHGSVWTFTFYFIIIHGFRLLRICSVLVVKLVIIIAVV